MPRRRSITGRNGKFWARLGCLPDPEEVRARIEAEVGKVAAATSSTIVHAELMRMMVSATTPGGALGRLREDLQDAHERIQLLSDLREQAVLDHARLHRLLQIPQEADEMTCPLAKGEVSVELTCSSNHIVVTSHAVYLRKLAVMVGWTEMAAEIEAARTVDDVLGHPAEENLSAVATRLHALGLTDEDVALLLLFYGEWSAGQRTPGNGVDVHQIVRRKADAVKTARAALRKK